jgi:hypothetical protein
MASPSPDPLRPSDSCEILGKGIRVAASHVVGSMWLTLLAVAAAPDLITPARELLGVPYELGGRLRGRGIDCQGVVFYAAERVSGCGWRSFSVYPTQSVARRELGRPVAGLSPVATASLAIERLAQNDVIAFVGFDENPAEAAIGAIGDRPVWVWHMGLYLGGGRFIAGDHFAGEVVELDLAAYLEAHAGTYDGILVTRLDGPPAPKTCRRHRPMRE